MIVDTEYQNASTIAMTITKVGFNLLRYFVSQEKRFCGAMRRVSVHQHTFYALCSVFVSKHNCMYALCFRLLLSMFRAFVFVCMSVGMCVCVFV